MVPLSHCVEQFELKGKGHSIGELGEPSYLFHELKPLQMKD
jgi:hypothetical protein